MVWKKQNEKYLIDNWQFKTRKELCKKLNCTISQLYYKAKKLNLSINNIFSANSKSKKWTQDEIEFLEENYNILDIKEICQVLNRSESAILIKANDLKLRRYNKWTKEEIKLLTEKYETATTEELENLFNHTLGSINKKAEKLNLVRKNILYKKWSDHEIQELKRLVKIGKTDEEIAKQLTRGIFYVKSMRRTYCREYFEWCSEEIKKLENIYSLYRTKELLKFFPNKTLDQIQKQANRMGLRKPKSFIWTDKEVNKLKEVYAKSTINELQKIFSKSKSQISKKAKRLGLKKELLWTEEEIKIVKNLYENTKIKDIVPLLDNKTKEQVGRKGRKLGLTQKFYKVWTIEETNLLKEKYPITTIYKLLELLPNKTKFQINNKAKSLCLKKNKEILFKCWGGHIPRQPDKKTRWRMKILKRDNFKCKECGFYDKTGVELNAHHIKPARDCNKKELFDIRNGICLCIKCHNKIYGKEYKVANKYKLIVEG